MTTANPAGTARINTMVEAIIEDAIRDSFAALSLAAATDAVYMGCDLDSALDARLELLRHRLRTELRALPVYQIVADYRKVVERRVSAASGVQGNQENT